ncbi:MAG: TatD family hydrolase [Candidatus Bipolaricaulota bacterium]
MPQDLPPLDAHAHFAPTCRSEELDGLGAALACTLSLAEACGALLRKTPHVQWGVGCHPRRVDAQSSFDPDWFGELTERTPLVGEVGLDARGSKVAIENQRRVFREVLRSVARRPRIVSIHSYSATRLILDELRQTPVAAPILHWWTGTAAETREAVALGCYFSVHSAVARRSIFRTAVPPERLLVESDHGWGDPPAAIPCRIEWVEHLLSAQLGRPREDVRRLAWRNLTGIVRRTETRSLLPAEFARQLDEFGHPDEAPERLL